MDSPRIAPHRNEPRNALSARRESGNERPSDVSLPPGEFFDTRVPLATVCPETALMYAVLEDALLDFQKQFEVDRRRNQQARQAEAWFFSDDFDWPLSFVSICDVLRLQPKFIRTKLNHWKNIGLDTAQR